MLLSFHGIKENPGQGDENSSTLAKTYSIGLDKKRIPGQGDENSTAKSNFALGVVFIKKESPDKGTKTQSGLAFH